MTSSLTAPLDDIVRRDDEFVQWRKQMGQQYGGFGLHPDLEGTVLHGEYQQWHVIGAAGHPFREAVITRVSSQHWRI